MQPEALIVQAVDEPNNLGTDISAMPPAPTHIIRPAMRARQRAVERKVTKKRKSRDYDNAAHARALPRAVEFSPLGNTTAKAPVG